MSMNMCSLCKEKFPSYETHRCPQVKNKSEEYTPEQRKSDLKSMVDTQVNFGSPHEYHRGMANGLMLGYAVAFEPYGSEVKYLEEPKRIEAVASNYPPDALSRIAWLEGQEIALKNQVAAAGVINHRKEAQIIGLRQQVSDLKVCIGKLKAIKKELRNIIDLFKERL